MVVKKRRLSHYVLKASQNVTCSSNEKPDRCMDMLTKNIHTKSRFFTNAQIHNGQIDFRHILHTHSLTDIFELGM